MRKTFRKIWRVIDIAGKALIVIIFLSAIIGAFVLLVKKSPEWNDQLRERPHQINNY